MSDSAQYPYLHPAFPMGRQLSRCADWLSDGILVANRQLPLFAAIHRAMPADGEWLLHPTGARHIAVLSALQSHVDELQREPLLPIVVHVPDDGSCPVPDALDVIPARWQWEAITEHGSYVFDGRIATAAMVGQPTDGWWWRLTFAFETTPTLVGGLADDRLFFLSGVMPRELAGVTD